MLQPLAPISCGRRRQHNCPQNGQSGNPAHIGIIKWIWHLLSSIEDSGSPWEVTIPCDPNPQPLMSHRDSIWRPKTTTGLLNCLNIELEFLKCVTTRRHHKSYCVNCRPPVNCGWSVQHLISHREAIHSRRMLQGCQIVLILTKLCQFW